MARFEIRHETRLPTDDAGWTLCFQYGTYTYEDRSEDESGYRFIYRDAEGRMRPQRGQARIPTRSKLDKLLAVATKQGWGDF